MPPTDTESAIRLDAAGVLRVLAGWPDLDTSQGLRCLGGNAATYVSLLGRLSEHHAGDDRSLLDAWRARDHAAVRRLAHSVKGSASVLGATRVAAAAEQLDLPDLAAADPELFAQQVAALVEALQSLWYGLLERAAIGSR